MTKTQVEVITSVQRRRSWSRAEKERIVAAAMEPGAVASEVAPRGWDPSRRISPTKRLSEVLCNPFGGRMSRSAEPQDLPPVMSQNQKAIQQPKCDGRHNE